jgi:hypothetical protein
MQPFVIHPTDAPRLGNELAGAVITQEVRHDGKRRFRKGHRIAPEDLPLIAELDRAIHAVRLDPDDVHEDDAARRLAALIAGEGLFARKPVQSRVNIAADRKGLTRIDPEAIFVLNTIGGIGIFTVPDRLPVLPGKIIAGAKIATVAVPETVLQEAGEYVASRPHPVLSVKPFLPHTVGVVVTEGLAENVRTRFEGAVRDKIRWYGSEILRFEYVAEDAEAVATALEGMLANGADLILTAGGNMMDPLDASLQALPEIDATVIRLGAPAHPGSMFWLGYTNAANIPIVNLASCSMYSRATVADLVLPWVMAGEQVTADDLASLGYGGLLDRDMGWRFPHYETDATDEPDET